MEAVADIYVFKNTFEEKGSKFRVFKGLISEGLEELKQDGTNGVGRLLFKAVDGSFSDFVVDFDELSVVENFFIVDSIGSKFDGE